MSKGYQCVPNVFIMCYRVFLMCVRGYFFGELVSKGDQECRYQTRKEIHQCVPNVFLCVPNVCTRLSGVQASNT